MDVLQVCFFGRHVFMGFLNNWEKTAEAIDEEGWLHSGDIGRIDEVILYSFVYIVYCIYINISQNGFLHITGRMKGIGNMPWISV